MNQLMYYGGFALAIALFILSAVFFILFKVPSIHKYFRNNSRKGLVEAEIITGDLKKKPSGPIHMTREEYENLTEVISLPEEESGHIDSNETDYLKTGEEDIKPEEPIESSGENYTGTEILSKTDLL